MPNNRQNLIAKALGLSAGVAGGVVGFKPIEQPAITLATTNDLDALRARLQELESQLANHLTESAAVPEPVTAPAVQTVYWRLGGSPEAIFPDVYTSGYALHQAMESGSLNSPTIINGKLWMSNGTNYPEKLNVNDQILGYVGEKNGVLEFETTDQRIFKGLKNG